MLRNLAQITAIVVFAIVVVFLGILLWRALFPSQPITHNGNEAQETYSSEQNATEDTNRGNRSVDDAVAYYTAWLAAFTALLVLVSAFQIGFLIRADSTAEKAANAAKDSVEVAARSQRPWLSIQGFKITNIYKIPGSKPSTFDLWIEATFDLKNSGAMPALRYFVARAMWIDDTKNGVSEIRNIRHLAVEQSKKGERLAVAPGATNEERINFEIEGVEDDPSGSKSRSKKLLSQRNRL